MAVGTEEGGKIKAVRANITRPLSARQDAQAAIALDKTPPWLRHPRTAAASDIALPWPRGIFKWQ